MKRKSRFSSGFTEQGAYLGAADVENIAQARQLRQCQVAGIAGEAVAQTGAVNEQRQTAFFAHIVQLRQLRFCIQGAALGGEGDIHHPRHDHVLMALIG